MSGWDTTALVANVKRRASVPTSQATVGSTDFLTIADEEMRSYIVPLVLACAGDYFVTELDQAIGTSAAYRMPARAIGGKLREIQVVDNAGRFVNLPQISVEQLDRAAFGCYVKGNSLWLWNCNNPIPATWVSLRMSYYSRPNALVATSAAGVVQSVNGQQVTLTGTPPAGFVNGALYDLVRANPGFECLATDVVGNVSGNVVTLATAPSSDLAPGDYVCLAQQSPVPQIPVELHPLLAQRAAVACLQIICDFDALDRAMALLGKMEAEARQLITRRIEGEPRRIVNRSSLFRQLF